MIETIFTLEMRQRLGDLLNRVPLRHDQFFIDRKGKPITLPTKPSTTPASSVERDL